MWTQMLSNAEMLAIPQDKFGSNVFEQESTSVKYSVTYIILVKYLSVALY